MKNIIIILSFTLFAYSQVKEDQLCITNASDQIYCIINSDIIDKMGNDPESSLQESYSDFLFHSKKLVKILKEINVKLYISSKVCFLEKELKNENYLYLYIKKGTKEAKVIRGIDSWAFLKQEADKYFRTKESN